MKKINSKIQKPVKYTIFFLFLVLLTFFIEIFGFNYRSIRYGLKDTEYDNKSTNVEINEKKHEVIYSFRSIQYINKLKIEANPSKDIDYEVEVGSVSSYGKKEECKFTDKYYRELGAGYTSIDRWVKKIVIRYSDPLEVQSITICSKLQLNACRMGFIFSILLLAFIVIKMKERILKRPEYLFVFLGAIIGSTLIFTSAARPASWDEEVHFKTIYENSFFGKSVKETAATLKYAEKVELPDYNTIEEKKLVDDYMNRSNHIDMGNKTKDVASNYTAFAYIPQTLIMIIARHLPISFSQMLMCVKFINLIFYLLIMAIAIAKTQIGKYALMCIGLLPTSIFQASSMTYDAFVLSFVSLGVVFLVNEIMEESNLINGRNVLIGATAIAIGSFSKMVYAPLLLLIFLIPSKRFENKRQALVVKIGGLFICGWLLATFVLPALVSMISQNVSVTTDLRGGDTDSTKQLISIFKHPIAYARELLGSIFSFENFGINENVRDKETIGTLMLLNYGGESVFPDKMAYVLIALFGILIAKNKEEKPLNRKSKIGIGIVLFIVVAFIWTALYLAFTPVGQTKIVGVQARYYLPFIWVVIITFYNSKIQLNVSKLTYAKLVLGITVFLNAYGFFAVLLQNHLM